MIKLKNSSEWQLRPQRHGKYRYVALAIFVFSLKYHLYCVINFKISRTHTNTVQFDNPDNIQMTKDECDASWSRLLQFQNCQFGRVRKSLVPVTNLSYARCPEDHLIQIHVCAATTHYTTAINNNTAIVHNIDEDKDEDKGEKEEGNVSKFRSRPCTRRHIHQVCQSMESYLSSLVSPTSNSSTLKTYPVADASRIYHNFQACIAHWTKYSLLHVKGGEFPPSLDTEPIEVLAPLTMKTKAQEKAEEAAQIRMKEANSTICIDSPLRFKTYIGSDTQVVRNFCTWVGESSTRIERCELPGVKQHCPMTCETCQMLCEDSPLLTQYTGTDNKLHYIFCKKIPEGDPDSICALDGVSASCRATCNSCFPKDCTCKYSDEDESIATPIYLTYRAIPFYIVGERTDAKYISTSTTIATHGSIEKLERLVRLCQSWPNQPISFALYTTDVEKDIGTLEEFWKLHLPEVVHVTVHLFISSATDLYPFNFLRNLAMEASSTDNIFALDVDFVPSTNTGKELDDLLPQLLQDAVLGTTHQVAVVIPAFQRKFESNVDVLNIPLPQVKSQMIEALHINKGLDDPVLTITSTHCESKYNILKEIRTKHLMRSYNTSKFMPFRAPYYIGHGPTDFERWYNATEPYEIQYEYRFEPYVVLNRFLAPRYWEMLRGFGWNKQAWIVELSQLKFQFMVAPNSFLIHVDHDDPVTAHKRVLHTTNEVGKLEAHLKREYVYDPCAQYKNNLLHISRNLKVKDKNENPDNIQMTKN